MTRSMQQLMPRAKSSASWTATSSSSRTTAPATITAMTAENFRKRISGPTAGSSRSGRDIRPAHSASAADPNGGKRKRRNKRMDISGLVHQLVLMFFAMGVGFLGGKAGVLGEDEEEAINAVAQAFKESLKND